MYKQHTWMHSMRCSLSTPIGTNRNMTRDVLLLVNLAAMQDKCQHMLHKNLIKHNKNIVNQIVWNKTELWAQLDGLF